MAERGFDAFTTGRRFGDVVSPTAQHNAIHHAGIVIILYD
jgi:hypothetical protein